MAERPNFPSRETVLELREQYPAGARVELEEMDDPYTALRPGDRGTVHEVDDAGTIHVDWDRGSRLGVIHGVDLIRKL